MKIFLDSLSSSGRWLALTVATCVCVLVLAPRAVAQAGALPELFEAARTNDAGKVRRMLDAGFDVNSTDANGDSLLLLASREGAADVARLVVARRARIDQQNRVGETAILLASIRGSTPIVRTLLDAGADPRASDWTPLHYAAAGGHEAVVKLLLAKGAEVDARSANGTTPLMMAVRQGHAQVVRMLLYEVADPNVKNEAGATALSMAQRTGQTEVEKLLRAAGARE